MTPVRIVRIAMHFDFNYDFNCHNFFDIEYFREFLKLNWSKVRVRRKYGEKINNYLHTNSVEYPVIYSLSTR